MERRNFLKLAFGVAAGAAAFTAAAQAAPLSPQPLGGGMKQPEADVHPAVTSSDEAAQLKPELVHWHGHGRRHHWGWGRRHWGWRHRRWHRHHW